MTTVNKVISLRAEEEGSNPFVVAFDSAPQSEILESAGSKRSKNGRITCYERPFKKRSLGGGDVAADSDGEGSPASDSDNNDANGKDFGRHIDVVAETPKVVFHGTTTGRTTLPLRHAIGIRDSKAGTITFVEVPPVVALHKFLKLGAEDLEEDVQREAGAAIDLKDYMKHKHSLTDTFGNHKKKLQIRAATANALPDKIDDVDEAGLQEAARAVAKGASEAAEAAKELTADLPALNPDAKTPAEAYALKDIVFPDVWNEMLATAADLMPYADEGPLPLSKKFAEAGPSLSVYTAERIKYINSVPKERLQTTLAALFLYNELVAFYQLPLGKIRSKKTLVKSSESVHIPASTLMSFSARFLDKVENEGRAPSFQRTKFSFLKMRNFMVILALAVEGYELSLSSVDHIARDFGIQAKEIRSYFEHVGAVRKSPAGSESSFGNQKWVLPAKPKPKTKVISAQRSQKKKSY